MNINLLRVALLRDQYAIVQSQILAYGKYDWRTTNSDTEATVGTLRRRLVDIELLIGDSIRLIEEGGGGMSSLPATPDSYGAVKYDNVTIITNANGQLVATKSTRDGIQDAEIVAINNKDSVQDADIITLKQKDIELGNRIVALETSYGTVGTDISSINSSLARKADLISGRLPSTQAPLGAIPNNFTVETEADITTLTTAIVNDRVKVTTTDEVWLLWVMPPTDINSWENITSLGGGVSTGVLSVNGKSGGVTLDLGDFPDVQGAISLLDSDISAVESQITAINTKNDNQDIAIFSAQNSASGAVTKNNEQDISISNAQATADSAVSVNNSQNSRLDALESYTSGGGGTLSYSESEQDTGKVWIDGNHVYQKTFLNINIGSPLVGYKWLTNSKNVKRVIDSEIYIHNPEDQTGLINYSVSNITGTTIAAIFNISTFATVIVNSNDVGIKHESKGRCDYSICDTTIFYTKVDESLPI